MSEEESLPWALENKMIKKDEERLKKLEKRVAILKQMSEEESLPWALENKIIKKDEEELLKKLKKRVAIRKQMNDKTELIRLLRNYSILLDELYESNTAGEFCPGYKGDATVEEFLRVIYCPSDVTCKKALKKLSLKVCISQSIEYDRQAAVKLMNKLKMEISDD